jgi:hypothetical protein
LRRGDETYSLDTDLGWHSFTRQRGEALHPERQPLATIENGFVHLPKEAAWLAEYLY